MKFKNMLLIIFCLWAGNVFAQTKELNLMKGDSLILNIGEYSDGTVRWARSSNQTSWVTLPASSSVLRTLPAVAYFWRAQVQQPDCETVYTDTLQVNLVQKWAGKTNKLNGGRGYIWPYVSSNKGLSMSENGELTNWTDSNRKAVWYLYQQAGRYDLSFIWSLTRFAKRDFKITCSPAFDGLDFQPVSRDFSYESLSSKKDTVWAISTVFPKTGYYRYELESKTVNGIITIHELMLTGYNVPGVTAISTAPHTTDYLSSPSVHLHYSSTASNSSGNVNDWVYQEVLVPDSAVSPTATYWEAIGFNGGYLGLQHNEDNHKRILFSVWDQIDADKYNAMGRPLPPDSLVSLVDKADYITSNSFGNEGTGGQSYFRNARTWMEGYPVKFLFNVRKDTTDCKSCASGKKPTVILSAWYCAYDPDNAPEGISADLKGWRYIASWRRPFVTDLQGGTGSFLENFGWTNGHLARKGYYYNTWAHNAATDTWNHFNSCYGSNTDGATGQRIDYEHGISTDPGHTDKFYMLSGGYGNTKKESSYTLPLKTSAEFPLKDLQIFKERVDQALEAEKARP
jgi:hypothetical protein